ncbi:MAG: hypothetical protein OXU20_39950 [Myxococcales bacterium]|nr:hypothetical protein [Myxococcales bacterium]MDD9968132.1 hypothetical protein [Myxococcales bacterium]
MTTTHLYRYPCAAGLLLAALTVFAHTSTVEAQEQFRADTWNKLSGSAGIRYGTDELNLGFGAHGGYTVEPGIYIGGLFDYFLGNDVFSAWMVLVEAGYDFGLAPGLVVRPVFDLGIVGVSVDLECPPGLEAFCDASSTSATELEAGLGAHILYNLDPITLGGELRFLFAETSSFIVGVNVGVIL